MHRTRTERLAFELRKFTKELLNDNEWRRGTIVKPNPSDIPPFEDICNLIDCNLNSHFDQREIDAIICCKNQSDFTRDAQLDYIQYAKNEKNDLWNNYKKLIRNPFSNLWVNADQKSSPLYKEWFGGNSRNSRADPNSYLFRPYPEESLFSHLRRIRKFLNDPKPNEYQKRLARSLFNYLVPHLFQNVNFSKKEQKAFMFEYGIRTRKPRKWEPLNILPGRYPLTEEQFKQFILLAIKLYLETSHHRYAESLLYIWLAQASARFKRKGFSVTGILENICLKNIMVTTRLDSQIKAKDVKIKIGKKHFCISMSLRNFIEAYADKRKADKSIFSIDRSTLENCLRELTRELGYDPKNFPVTPETFLERTVRHNQRYLPCVSR